MLRESEKDETYDITLIFYINLSLDASYCCHRPGQELGALAVLIRKRRDNLQEVNHANAVEMESIRSKTAEAIAKAKEDHEKKVRHPCPGRCRSTALLEANA